MSENRIGIIGIGGIGGFFAAKLIGHYRDDDLKKFILIQRGKHLEEIRENGLTYISNDNETVVMPDLATDDPSEAGRIDVVIICTKSYDLENVAELIKGSLHEDSVILSTLNGVDTYERLKTILPGHHVLDGCIYVSAKIERPGLIRRVGGMGNYFFGPIEGETEKYRWIEEFLQDAGIMAELSDDIKTIIWKKYLFTSSISSVTSACGRNIGYVINDKESRELFEGLIREIIDLAGVMGVDLPSYMPEWAVTRIEIMNPEIKTSMQLDIERGKMTEIGIFTEFVVKKSQEYGLSVPLHDSIYRELLKKI